MREEPRRECHRKFSLEKKANVCRRIGSSSNRKYIIGGAVGGGVLVLILLALFLFCRRKRRAKRGLELFGGDHSKGELGYGQFVACDHEIYNGNNGQLQMEQKSPLTPFIFKSDSAALTTNGQQQPVISLERRDSTESHASAGSDSNSSYSCDSEGSRRSRRSQKRPPPLKLTSLVTPVINGPQNNPCRGVDHPSFSNPHEVPTIIAEPPQYLTPDRMRRY